MRFLADENASRLVIERLRADWLDVISISDILPGAPDKDVLAVAEAGGCIVITEDRDFGELVICQHLTVRGVILLELDCFSNATEANVVADIVSTHTDKLLGNLLVVEPGRVGIQAGRSRARAACDTAGAVMDHRRRVALIRPAIRVATAGYPRDAA